MLLLLFLLIIIIAVLSAYFVYKNRQINKTRYETKIFQEDLTEKILSVTNSKELPENIKNYLSIINDATKLKDERYQALSMLGFAFSYEYTISHDPSIRKFSSVVLGAYAKSQFPEFYNESDFNIPCADSQCGQELDPEIEKVIKTINENEIPDYMKNTIIRNLTSAGYAPDSDLAEKKYGIKLAVDQLRRTGDPEASQSAEKLVKYFKDRYKADL